MKQPLISIIAPVYNVEKYLQRCIDSIINQDYKNIEIIIVDDGSTDGSSDVIKLNAKNDSRIKVIHQENQGVSSARNAGLDVAAGDYIMFVDADDTIDAEACKECVDALEGNEDIVYFSTRRVNELGEGSVIEGSADGTIEKLRSNKQVIEYYLGGDNLRIIACVLKRSRLGDLRFDTSMRIHEDAVFAFQFLTGAESAVVINKPMYSYISRPGSAMKSFRSSDIADVRRHCEVVKRFMLEHYPELIDQAYARLLPTMFNLLTVAKSVSDHAATIDARKDIRHALSKAPSDYKMLKSHKFKYLLSYLPLSVFNFVLYRARKARKVI